MGGDNLIKKFQVILGLVVSCSLVPKVAPAAEGFVNSLAGLPSTLQRPYEATVSIERSCSTAYNGGKATGVIIGTAGAKSILIATAFHVVTSDNCSSNLPLRISFTGIKNNQAAEVFTMGVVVRKDASNDLALVQADLPSGVQATIAELAPIDTPAAKVSGSQVLYAIGYPDLNKRSKKMWHVAAPENSGDRLKRISTGRQFMLAPYEMQNPESKKMSTRLTILHDTDLLPGSSGGPIVDELGRVRGIVTSIINITAATKPCDMMEYCDVGKNRFYTATPYQTIHAALK